jgi:DNA-binding NarL/FixJ family response regulator
MSIAVAEPLQSSSHRLDHDVLELEGGLPEDSCRPQRVLVVDDQELLQFGLRAVLAGQPWVAWCRSVGSLDAAWEVVRRHQPQLVIVSTSVQGRSGLDFCRELLARMPHVRVVLMSGDGRVPTSVATACGAVAFLPKGLPARGVVTIVHRVAEGGRAFPKERGSSSVKLSRRELEVLQQLVQGLSNPEVALRLNLSRHTVKQHTSTLYRKLDVRNRAQAAGRARELGLVL